jgi:hypothetical protein
MKYIVRRVGMALRPMASGAGSRAKPAGLQNEEGVRLAQTMQVGQHMHSCGNTAIKG